MQVEHNGETWQVERVVHRTLGELLDACLADDPAERCWVRVHVDGREIPEHDWAALRERSCDDVGRVRLESRTLAEAARASLAHARDYCAPVEAAIGAVAAGLRAGRREDAMATYAHLLDAFGVLAGTLAAVGHVLATEHGDDAARELARCEDELLPWL